MDGLKGSKSVPSAGITQIRLTVGGQSTLSARLAELPLCITMKVLEAYGKRNLGKLRKIITAIYIMKQFIGKH